MYVSTKNRQFYTILLPIVIQLAYRDLHACKVAMATPVTSGTYDELDVLVSNATSARLTTTEMLTTPIETSVMTTAKTTGTCTTIVYGDAILFLPRVYSLQTVTLDSNTASRYFDSTVELSES